MKNLSDSTHSNPGKKSADTEHRKETCLNVPGLLIEIEKSEGLVGTKPPPKNHMIHIETHVYEERLM